MPNNIKENMYVSYIILGLFGITAIGAFFFYKERFIINDEKKEIGTKEERENLLNKNPSRRQRINTGIEWFKYDNINMNIDMNVKKKNNDVIIDIESNINSDNNEIKDMRVVDEKKNEEQRIDIDLSNILDDNEIKTELSNINEINNLGDYNTPELSEKDSESNNSGDYNTHELSEKDNESNDSENCEEKNEEEKDEELGIQNKEFNWLVV